MVKDVPLLTQDLSVAQGDAASQNIEILPHALMESRKTQKNPRVEESSAKGKEEVRGTTQTSDTAEVQDPRQQRFQGNTTSCSPRHETSRRGEDIQICSPRQQRSSGEEHRSHSPRHMKSRGRDDPENRPPRLNGQEKRCIEAALLGIKSLGEKTEMVVLLNLKSFGRSMTVVILQGTTDMREEEVHDMILQGTTGLEYRSMKEVIL